MSERRQRQDEEKDSPERQALHAPEPNRGKDASFLQLDITPVLVHGSVGPKEAYSRGMFERTTRRALPVLNRAADVAPAVQACCGACRTCVTTNLVGVALAGAAGMVALLRRLFRVRPT
jgi:hypothetical protein